ncbi:unnamed protein product [Parascedosporium putredinis]|uniref:Transcription factor domain-containing protein n=1 Tax=Parascedosporium putredinis TaxID=1442378 RepID=A0A9P1H047_9PEZI|nr:unnamed protein product [Parascedosporium putredinis]CAI7992422.1 unnamed protein product [Parascedosporium putredinis]
MVTAATTAAVASEVLRFEWQFAYIRMLILLFKLPSQRRSPQALADVRRKAQVRPPSSEPAGRQAGSEAKRLRAVRAPQEEVQRHPTLQHLREAGPRLHLCPRPRKRRLLLLVERLPGLTPPPGPGPELDGATIELPPRFFDDASSSAIMIPHTSTQWLDVTGLDAAQQLHLSISPFLSARLRFVVRFTSTNCIADAFGCLNSALRKQIMAMTPPTLGMAPSTQGLGLNLGWEQPNLAVSLGSMDPLSQQQYLLADVNTIFGKSSLSMNLDKFIAAFWLFWSPNWPVLHRPTFNATERSSRLVAALAVMGACLTSEKSDRQQALGWMPSIEDWVFANAYLSDQPIPHTMDDMELALIQGRIEAIQAAYTLLLMLLWEGPLPRRPRGRGGSVWKMFAMRQECVRAILYVFLIDCAFIIYNNTPPRMIISELQYDTVCPDSCFNAPDPDSWCEAMRQWAETGPAAFLSIADLIETSLKEDLTPPEWDSLEQTSLLNLFAIASAFHNLIFHHHNGPESHIRSDRVSRGLRNWVRVWGDRDPVPTEIDSAHPDLTGQPGFIRYVREYWSLAVIFNDQYEYRKPFHPKQFEGSHGAAQRRGDVRLMPETDSSNMSPIHELVVRFRDVDLSSSLC